MKHLKKSALLWYSPHEMYELVTAVEAYPSFLPWCERVDVLRRDADGPTARLHLAYSGVRHAFTTRNVQVPDEAVRIGLVDGPFSVLEGTWLFRPLVLAQGGPPEGCRIDFELRYAFANRALEALISPVFDRIANTLVDSFVKRAETVHGMR